jgi:hypothetical protein
MKISVLTGTVIRGRCWNILGISDSASPASAINQTLLADYVTSQTSVSFPGSPIKLSTEGEGWFHDVTVPDPLVGLDIQISPPINSKLRIFSITYVFTTNVGGVNRTFELIGDYSFGRCIVFPALYTQLPGTVTAYYWEFRTYAIASRLIGALFHAFEHMTEIILNDPVNFITVWTVGKDLLNDQYSGIIYSCEEWINV